MQPEVQGRAQETPGAFLANQFGNPANPTAHRTTTGPEMWEQMQGNIDAVVAGRTPKPPPA